VSLDRLQQLEASEARADLQARHIELLQKQIAETSVALKEERALSEKQAEAMMRVARTCERSCEMKEQHAAALRAQDAATAIVEDDNAALKAKLRELAASHAASIAKLDAQHVDAISKLEVRHKEVVADLKAECAALRAHAELKSTLTEILAAVTTGAMEVLPVRADSRQFVEWRLGGIPPPAAAELPSVPQFFDRAWCAAVSAEGWKAAVDANVCATVTRVGPYSCTLRSAAPLARSPF
jgi:hypothetical protein